MIDCQLVVSIILNLVIFIAFNSCHSLIFHYNLEVYFRDIYFYLHT